MFLAIDVGNTQTTLGLFDEAGSLVRGWRMSTTATDTSDMLHARLFSFFAKDGLELGCVSEAGVASVVPALERSWRRCLEAHLGHRPLVVRAGESYGMEVAMPNPRQVGADRIANAIAARSTYGAPVIVVDFGTATNIDVVDASGAYRGGAISPGLMLSAGALFSRAAKLASIPIEAPERALGDSTEAALQSGLVIGAAAQAEGLVARIRAELGAPGATVVGTGGLARTVAKATELFDAIDPDLTLRGIREIWLWERAGGRE
ncbi:type III pantothenate kinase [Thermophilibacter provencensis]|uniref:Type III pantothenate kinase n=1 Tax=Thermophilibacter provencensis TaxID=1852386 RepID=A0ABT7V2B6_9ACTN|nr:type III pantothenate kinase [Thermophilibacter provencensis]MDM8270750.1 type III pantothenate kinase [Thermophilibacter provencensis]